MSYDLMVFRPQAASADRSEFIEWYEHQIQWKEDHNYNDPSICSVAMKNWYTEMTRAFPDVNVPGTDPGDETAAEYSIGKDIIYVAFSLEVAEKAYSWMKSLAAKHEVGFFDVSADNGDILFPDGTGRFIGVEKPGKAKKC